MNAHRFTVLAHTLASIPTRRHVLHGLTGLGLALAGSSLHGNGDAKKKKGKKKKKKQKDKPPIPPPAPPPPQSPPPPPGCTPTCAGKPCGTDDGCGGICGCAAGSVCHEGTCHPCTITCDGNGTACGDKLKAALANGGTIYACPGRYEGNFELSATNLALIGAGEGDDPAANTILDANQSGRVMLVKPGVSAALHRLRITGGNLPSGFLGGAGIYTDGGTVTLNGATVIGNLLDNCAPDGAVAGCKNG